MKNALARIEFRLDLPERKVQQILAARMLKPDDGSEGWHQSACTVLEEAIKDDIAIYVEYSTDEPEVEVNA